MVHDKKTGAGKINENRTGCVALPKTAKPYSFGFQHKMHAGLPNSIENPNLHALI